MIFEFKGSLQHSFISFAIATIETETPWTTFIRLNLQVGKYFRDQLCWQIMKTDIPFVLARIRNGSSPAIVNQLWRLHMYGVFSSKHYEEELRMAWKVSLVTLAVLLYVSFPTAPTCAYVCTLDIDTEVRYTVHHNMCRLPLISSRTHTPPSSTCTLHLRHSLR